MQVVTKRGTEWVAVETENSPCGLGGTAERHPGCVLETTAQFVCLIEKTTAPGLETRKSSGLWVGNKITVVLFEKTKGLRGKILGIGMMLGIHSKSQHRQQSTA